MKDDNDLKPFIKQWELIKKSPIFKIFIIIILIALIKSIFF